jgi:hypothetical protein
MAENISSVETTGRTDYQAQVPDDEIDLVDLWLFFWEKRKIFFFSAILILVVGIVGFKMFYEQKQVSTVRSLIVLDNKVVDIKAVFGTKAVFGDRVSLSVQLASHIEYVVLPQMALLPEYELVKSYVLATKAIPVAGTNMVEVTNQVSGNDTDDLVKFQSQLVEQIYAELNNSSYSLSGGISSSLASLNSSAARLQHLISALDWEAGLTLDPQDVSYQLFLNQLDARKNGLSKELDDLTISLNELESELTLFKPHIAVKGQVSGKTTGIKPTTAYVLIFVLAFFLAIFIVVGAAFVSKVQARLAGRG